MKVRCMSKNRNDKGNIINYTLQDETGKIFQATAQQIKAEMQGRNFEFTNLQIDKAGRLVDKAEEKKQPEAQIKNTKPQSEADSRIMALAEKRETAKDEISKYIKMIAKEYTNDDWGDEKFIADYTEKDKYGEKYEDSQMVEVTRKYFKKLIKIIEDEALDTEIRASRMDYYNFSVKFPDEVEKFFKASNCESCIREALFYLAGQNHNLAIINCGIDDACDGFVGNKILTGNYEEAKKFISRCLVEEAENSDESPIEILKDGVFVSGGNDLGEVFILRYYAEVQGHGTEYYRKKVLESFNKFYTTNEYMNAKELENAKNEMLDILEHTTEGFAYLALKHNLIPPRDDFSTDGEKSRAIVINKEAEYLVRLHDAIRRKLQ